MIKSSRVKALQIENLLSFGDDSPEIAFGDLNLLVGPNGSGKSNLIEVLGLLRSTPKDFAADSDEISELLWKGQTKGKPLVATIRVRVGLSAVKPDLLYSLSFTRKGAQLQIVDEKIRNELPDKDHKQSYLYFDYNGGRPLLNVKGKTRSLKHEDVDPQQSVLSQRQDPDQYPEVTYLGRFFGNFRLYRNWDFGPVSGVRDLYSAGQKNDFLAEDISNLGLMLNKLRADPEAKSELLRHLRMFYEGAVDILTPIQGGLVDLRIEEANGISIPASRLSDGTLRWLSLLTILLHPEPPPLLCIEEPELGLHPDMIHPLAKLLENASERTQLVVTTHSTDLVDAFSTTPNAVVICEKVDGSTTLKRLDADALSEWLDRYSLGQLWRSGEIGGNRW